MSSCSLASSLAAIYWGCVEIAFLKGETNFKFERSSILGRLIGNGEEIVMNF